MESKKQRLEAIFGAAIDLSGAEQRDIYLGKVCGDDKALRLEVEELLRAYDNVGAFLTGVGEEKLMNSDPGVPSARLVLPVTEKPGDNIGRYKLREQIGEGGCGVVYVAEQEEPVRRQVALKVVKFGMDTRSVMARFEAERQALALMDHPNIAKVLDAGATETGRPFFVMELVRGVRITEYCDRNHLPPAQRLSLFVQVCHAIQHAHQKGVIHRDIKPSNILVTLHDEVPVPKVIDFGIAKATSQQRLTDKTVYTAFEHFLGTPSYMSPEQADMSGLDIDTRSDVYALGVLLYELLTGTTPFDAKTLLSAGLDEMRRIIREQDPVRPSTRLSTMLGGQLTTTARQRRSEPHRLIHSVRGDLDWIVMKCLEKDRTRRYETANALAQDIERHLRQEPINACPPSTAYRLEKFFRRNRVKATAAAAIAAALVIGSVVSTLQAVRASRAERNHQAQRRVAELQEYSASIALAQALLEQQRYGEARETLAKPRLAPLRGWEWGWLQRNCHRDLMTFSSGRQELIGVALSPDGRWLAAGCFDATARLWDLANRVARPPLKGHSNNVVLLGFSPDSERLVTASFDRTAKVWDVASGQLLFTLLGHSNWVYAATFSPDGKTIATGSRDRTVRLWSAADGSPLGIVGKSGDAVMCVAFSPDGTRLAYAGGSGLVYSRSKDTTVRVLDLATRHTQTLTGHSHSISGIAFNPEGTRIASASWDKTARIGEVPEGREMRILYQATNSVGVLCAVAFSPDSRLCAVAGGVFGTDSQRIEAGVHLIDSKTGSRQGALQGHARMIRSLAFSSDGNRLASTSFDGTAKLWSTALIPDSLSLEGHDQPVWTVATSPNGKFVATGSLDQTAKIWHLDTGQLLMNIPVNFPVLSLAFSPDSTRLVTVAERGRARVWSLSSLQQRPTGQLPVPEPLLTLGQHSNVVTSVAYSPNGLWIATGSKDRTARIWDSVTGRIVRVFDDHQGHQHWILSLAFSPDGERILTASADGRAIIWDAQSGRMLLSLEGHQGPVLQAVWSPDGNTVATGGQDRTIRLWSAKTGATILPPLEAHGDGVTSLAFSPDGRRLASAAGGIHVRQALPAERAVILWDPATGQNLMRLTAHLNVVRAVAFSPDGTRLITASQDNTARIRKAFPWKPEDYPGTPTQSLEERLEAYKTKYWQEQLSIFNPASLSGIGELSPSRRTNHVTQHGAINVAAEPPNKTKPLRPIPSRNPAARQDQIDLSHVYNAALDEAWQPTTGFDDAGQDLSRLPSGLVNIGNLRFDIRGLVQLRKDDSQWESFPHQVSIPVGRHLRHLHVLHGAANVESDGEPIAILRLFFADDHRDIQVVYGRDVRDWWVSKDDRPCGQNSEVAWMSPPLTDGPLGEYAPFVQGSRSPLAGSALAFRIFKTSYTNPLPEIEVRRIEFISNMKQAAPFLIALTVN